jgi:hypothetical protein
MKTSVRTVLTLRRQSCSGGVSVSYASMPPRSAELLEKMHVELP